MDKLVTKEKLLTIKNNTSLAVINGSFYLLHPGHIHFINAASTLVDGSKIVVILLDDENIKRRKGTTRPIYKLDDRIMMLEAITGIDYILAWTQPWEDLRLYILELKPNYFIAGDDDPGLESKRDFVERAGGKFIIVQKMGEHSVTGTIEKIKK